MRTIPRILSVLLLVMLTSYAETTPDFTPLGFGAASRGGEGGELIQVTNLNDSGSGSLRAALSNRRDPRIITFAVEGTIQLSKPIRADYGRVTIEGTTAPGEGITLQRHGLYFKGDCDDIIIRGLRILIESGGDAGDGITFLGANGGTIERVLVDRCSILGATDEALDTWGSVRDLTCQWTILAEGRVDGDHAKGSHSMGWLSGPETDRVTIHHCLFAHNGDRNPKLQGGLYEVVNNVIYNWGGINALKVKDGARINLIANTFRAGADSQGSEGCAVIEDPEMVKGHSLIFAQGNLGPLNPNTTEGFWENVNWFESLGEKSKRHRPAPMDFQSGEVFPGSSLPYQSAQEAFAAVLAHAGPLVRNKDESRIVEEVKQGSGRLGRPSD